MPETAITLKSGASSCTLYPGIGAALAGWSVAGQNMLRCATADDIAAHNPLRMSSFPLVPYSNRIGDARFTWDDQQVSLAPNFAPEPHAIHGVGWTRAWEIAEQSPTSALLRYRHATDHDWQWAFTAEQRATLTSTSLSLVLRVRNDHDAPVPLAFGHHPYFDSAGARLKFAAANVWMNGEDALPSARLVPVGGFAFDDGAAVAGKVIDHCYSGWTGRARIEWAGRPRALDIVATPNLPAAVVYIPKGGDIFCFEPVPHVNNALNLNRYAAMMPIVAPGDWFAAEIIMRAVEP
jgi:aldose 1-epimerase